MEIGSHRRQSHRDDGGVERGHERTDGDHEQRVPTPPLEFGQPAVSEGCWAGFSGFCIVTP